MTLSYRAAVARDWDARRCEPGVVVLAGWLKPTKDPRTAAQYAKDNWSFCQKQYVQNIVRTAAEAPAAVARAQEGLVHIVTGITGTVADVFFGVWRFCYEAYSSFMEKMKGAAKLFQNFLLKINDVVMRLQGSALSIAYGLIALTVAFINSIQVALIVAIIVVGILLALMVILFFLLMPISSIILTMTAVIATMVITVTTAIAAATIAEMFTPGACFDADTQIALANGKKCPIQKIRVGDSLAAGTAVTAVTAIHEFETHDMVWTYDGIRVTGDHLIDVSGSSLLSVRHDGRFVPTGPGPTGPARRVWCLTTTNRRIPVIGCSGRSYQFADWEEIDDDDTVRLQEWFTSVWRMLNPQEVPASTEIIAARAIQSDAGVSPDAPIAVPAVWGGGTKRACDIRIGDMVIDANGMPTRVIGCVEMQGDLATDAVALPHSGAIVTSGCWIWDPSVNLWTPPLQMEVTCIDLHPARWVHLYTASGTFRVGGWSIRDASDVGLSRIGEIVDKVVCNVQI